MALVMRKTDPQVAKIGALNNGNRSAIGAGANFHLDASELTVIAADASGGDPDGGLAGCIALANQIKAVYNFHVVDILAHQGSDSDEATAVANAVDLTTLLALGTDLAAKYELHRVETAGPVHYNADSTNALASTTVDTLAHAIAVMNDMKAKLNLHMASAPAGQSARVVEG